MIDTVFLAENGDQNFSDGPLLSPLHRFPPTEHTHPIHGADEIDRTVLIDQSLRNHLAWRACSPTNITTLGWPFFGVNTFTCVIGCDWRYFDQI